MYSFWNYIYNLFNFIHNKIVNTAFATYRFCIGHLDKSEKFVFCCVRAELFVGATISMVAMRKQNFPIHTPFSVVWTKNLSKTNTLNTFNGDSTNGGHWVFKQYKNNSNDLCCIIETVCRVCWHFTALSQIQPSERTQYDCCFFIRSLVSAYMYVSSPIGCVELTRTHTIKRIRQLRRMKVYKPWQAMRLWFE